MRAKIFIVIALLTSLTMWAQGESQQEPEVRRLELVNQSVNMGTISGDSIVTATFTVRNVGDEPVSIMKVFSSCNCAVASYSKEPIAPGDSLNFEVRYDPRDSRWGEFRRTFRIRTSDNKYLSAILKGSIARKYRR